MKEELQLIIDSTSPLGLATTIRNKKNIKVYASILEQTKFLDKFNPSITQRIFCIINNIFERPKCKYCKDKYVRFRSITNGYNNFCSGQCGNKSEEIKELKSNTRNNWSDEKKENFRKKVSEGHSKRTKEEIYKSQKKLKQTKLEKYGDKNYNNREKFKQTCLEKYNVENVMQSNEIQNKAKQTCLEKYGEISYTKTKECKNKIKNTKLKRYGDENYVNPDKAKLTLLERYGDENYNNHEKQKETCLKRYGVKYNFQRPEVNKKSMETRSKLINELIESNCDVDCDFKKLAENKGIFWNLGLNETKILNQVEKDKGIKLIRQYSVLDKYFVDGYDKVNNICYEVDEIYHLNDEQIEKDKVRQQKIENELNCTFIRIPDLTH